MPLRMGSAIHAGLYTLYTENWNLDAAKEAFSQRWGSSIGMVLPKHYTHMTEGHGHIILENYHEDYNPHDGRAPHSFTPHRVLPEELNLAKLLHCEYTTDENGYVNFAETPIAVDWGGVPYAGQLDLLVESPDGSLYVVDFKTTGNWLGDSWIKRYKRSHQLRGYAAMVQIITGRPVLGVYVVGVYTGRAAADKYELWSHRSSVRSGIFGPYTFSDNMLFETRAWAAQWEGAIKAFRKTKSFPQNDRACQFCEFNRICDATPLARPRIMKREYDVSYPTGILASGADS